MTTQVENTLNAAFNNKLTVVTPATIRSRIHAIGLELTGAIQLSECHEMALELELEELQGSL